MVTNASSFGRSGVHDFLLIRASAVIMASFAIFMLVYLLCQSPINFQIWYELFQFLPMKIYTFITLVALLIHSWIGIWQVLTDYIKNILLRGVLLFAFIITAFSYLTAGIMILWSV